MTSTRTSAAGWPSRCSEGQATREWDDHVARSLGLRLDARGGDGLRRTLHDGGQCQDRGHAVSLVAADAGFGLAFGSYFLMMAP